MTPTTEKTVREIAIENPATIRVFESLGIDYCCGGGRALTEACARANVSVTEVLERIEKTTHGEPKSVQDAWATAPLTELIEHIVTRHHSFVKQESPRLELLLDKVRDRHGKVHPELESIEQLFTALSQELSAHMLKEERILFPYINQLEAAVQGGNAPPMGCFGSIEMPIARMLAEHDDAGELLAQIRKLAHDYQPPQDACPNYRWLYQGLDEFERDLHLHVHLENNILFPRAVDLERSSEAAR